jgi:predicted ATPase
LLGLAVTGADGERIRYLEPPMLRSLIFAHVTELVAHLAQQPLVLFLDDLHWIDPTSLDLLEALMPLTERYPLLLLAAFRPRRLERSWRFHESAERDYAHRYTPLALQPLDEEQSRQLVANLLYVENLPERVRRLILDKAEGNPFFVEEVIRSLLDNGLVVYEDGMWRATAEIVHISVPATLVGVITARLDRLDEGTRRIVQAGAVLGREFIFETLADLYDAPELLEAGLAELQRRDMVREKSRAQHRLYAFKHVLTQEAAYHSILLSRRRELHHRAAASLVRRQPDRPADIAHHFIEARQQAQAVPYLVQAGDQATRNYASTEAMDFYRRALELREIVEETALVRRAYEGLGNILALTGQLPEALGQYQAMLAFAESRRDVGMQVSALNKLAAVTALRMGQFAEAEPYLMRVERVAHEHDDAMGIAEMSIIRCQMCTVQADFDTVIKHMDEVTAIGQRLGSKEYMAMGLEHLASSLMYLTRFEEAEATALEGLAVAREVGDREHESWLLSITLPVCLMCHGDLGRVRETATEGAQMATRIGSLMTQVFGYWVLAEVARWQGEYEEALRYGQSALQAALPIEAFMPFIAVQPFGSLGLSYLEISPQFMDKISDVHLHALRLLEAPGGTAGGGSAWADMGWCALTIGDLEMAAACFEKGLHEPSVFILVERPRYLAGSALVASKQGRRDDALMLVEEACAYTEKRSMRHLYPLMRLAAGQIHAAWGDHRHALVELELAENLAAGMQMRPLLWQAQEAAANTLDALGRPREAAQKRQAAQGVIQEIAGLFEDDTLRQAYLSQHTVN